MGKPRAVTVVVPTRNRGAEALATVESVLANSHTDFGVLVVDQSDSDDTETALHYLRSDPRVAYVRSSARGAGMARNSGIRISNSPLIAFVDDDCEVPRDWLDRLVAVFDANPDTALVFCNVVPGPHDSAAGFIPEYERTDELLVDTMRKRIRARAISAGMAIRREPIVAMGAFDELMGPGSRFLSAEDRDLSVRAILAGENVIETASTHVVHHGFRSYEEGKALTKRDFIGLGAMSAKLVKRGQVRAWGVVAYEFVVPCLVNPARDLLHGRRPQGLSRGRYFLTGFVQALVAPVDHEMLTFQAISMAHEEA